VRSDLDGCDVVWLVGIPMDEERGTADLREVGTWFVHENLHAGDLWNRMIVGHC
jgi:hypothetical protein